MSGERMEKWRIVESENCCIGESKKGKVLFVELIQVICWNLRNEIYQIQFVYQGEIIRKTFIRL